MKEVLNHFLPSLTWKQRFIVFYFVLSLCLLCIGDETPLWIIILVVVNFANAARLVKKVPLPEIKDEYESND
jgi:hypothetical protein